MRPLMGGEIRRGEASTLAVAEDRRGVRAVVAGLGGQVMSKSFGFQACLGPTVKQADVMPLCGIPSLLDAALAGFHVTILAYGQTGSGKTFTMSGREEVLGGRGYAGGHAEDGIVTRAEQYLYRKKRELGDSWCSFSASYLEIYNEQVFDLNAGDAARGGGGGEALSPREKRPLPLRWDEHFGFHVPGLQVVPCPHYEDALAVLSQGMRSRHVASHELNQDSSRSHSMTTLHAWTAAPGAGGGGQGPGGGPGGVSGGARRMGKVTFVDLAGSERLKQSRTADGKETGSINRSLFALGKVIAALADNVGAGGGAAAHIPYRDSALTKLLTDSLGGSSLALMIACCSSSLRHLEETLSTLNYATRAKNIQNRPAVKMDAQQQLVACLRQEIDMLRSGSLLQAAAGHWCQQPAPLLVPAGGSGHADVGPLPPALAPPSRHVPAKPRGAAARARGGALGTPERWRGGGGRTPGARLAAEQQPRPTARAAGRVRGADGRQGQLPAGARGGWARPPELGGGGGGGGLAAAGAVGGRL